MSALITGVCSLRAHRARTYSCTPCTRRPVAAVCCWRCFLSALPLQVEAENPSVSISVSPNAGGPVSHHNRRENSDLYRNEERGQFKRTDRELREQRWVVDLRPSLLRTQWREMTIPPSPSPIHFLRVAPQPMCFSVTINDDDSYEPNEYFKLTVTGSYQSEGNTINFGDEVIVRIRENDERYLTLSPVSNSALVAHPEFMAKEVDKNNDGKNELTISLNKPLPYDLVIDYTVGDDPHTTASANDFTMKNGTAQIPDGSLSVTIDIGIIDDQLVEPTEYFTLGLRTPKKEHDPGNALGTYNQVTFQDSKLPSQPLSVSIMDNDTVPPTGGVVYPAWRRGRRNYGVSKHEEDSYRRPESNYHCGNSRHGANKRYRDSSQV